MLPEYDFSGGVRGKYVARYRRAVNVVVLDRDVWKEFPDSQQVNDALRKLIKARSARTLESIQELMAPSDSTKTGLANGRRRKKTG